MSRKPTQNNPTPVPNAAEPRSAKQVGGVRARWAWTEAAVWTNRMLTALEKGVKGSQGDASPCSSSESSGRGARKREARPIKWFSVIDKVASEENLFASFVRVAKNDGAPGVDHVTTDQFAKQQAKHFKRLHKTLLDGTYAPHALRRVWIDKPGSKEKRPLGIPTVRDRIVQTALRNAIAPIFEKDFAEQSYGFRPNRGCKDALREVDRLVKAGYAYVVDADLKSYFDTIPHDRLMRLVREKLSDGRVLDLIEKLLKQGIMDGLKEWTPEEGAPQGAVVSPLLSNIYLDPLDHLMAELGFKMIRYADDFVVLCRGRKEAERALARVQAWVNDAELSLHPEKTKIVDAREEAFEFLGYEFHGEHRWPRKKSLMKLKATIRAKTKRTNGHGMKYIVTEVNKTLRGWFEYFKHSNPPWVFKRLDPWIRMRLRSILRKRHKGKGRGRGKDHFRWPNRYFTELGLFSLMDAWESARQSSTR